jgi:hypothetical protein
MESHEADTQIRRNEGNFIFAEGSLSQEKKE